MKPLTLARAHHGVLFDLNLYIIMRFLAIASRPCNRKSSTCELTMPTRQLGWWLCISGANVPLWMAAPNNKSYQTYIPLTSCNSLHWMRALNLIHSEHQRLKVHWEILQYNLTNEIEWIWTQNKNLSNRVLQPARILKGTKTHVAHACSSSSSSWPWLLCW